MSAVLPKLPNRGARKRRSTAFNKPHAHGPVVEKDVITPKMVDPYTLHPDVYSMDTRGHMGSDVIVYDAKGVAIERILAATRERVPFGQKPVEPIRKLIVREAQPARRRMRENFKRDPVLTAAALPNSSPRLMYSGVARRLNPGI